MGDTRTLREGALLVQVENDSLHYPYIKMTHSVELAVAKCQVPKTIFCEHLHEWELVRYRFPIVHLLPPGAQRTLSA